MSFSLAAFAAAVLAGPAPQSGASGIRELLAEGEDLRVDAVLVILNDQVLTESDVRLEAVRMARSRPGAAPGAFYGEAIYSRLREMVAREGFARLGLDMSMLQAQVDDRLASLIEEEGSRARFEAGLRADGHDLTSFRAMLEGAFVRFAWEGIALGDQPSPLEGYRNQVVVTPAEIREEFERNPEAWKQEELLVWTTLQFFDDVSGPGLERARAVAEQLRSGTLDSANAAAQADSTKQDGGDPARKGLREDLRQWLAGALPGTVGEVEAIPGLGAQFLVLLERKEAREIGFAEAQSEIARALRERKRVSLLNDEMSAVIRSSYLWYAEELADLMRQVPGVKAENVGETEF